MSSWVMDGEACGGKQPYTGIRRRQLCANRLTVLYHNETADSWMLEWSWRLGPQERFTQLDSRCRWNLAQVVEAAVQGLSLQTCPVCQAVDLSH
ncbi:hypothetical protein GDO81_027457 [Engystomops pustulosus]|uniref:Uncharacterized protein n=1 Tax=Engystomops pustulosus TaxID=76066 RepID=A0AAV6YKW7_ENGPU|nr:hypothetical protein GDO81_027457 [Engystomops pustulosus]